MAINIDMCLCRFSALHHLQFQWGVRRVIENRLSTSGDGHEERLHRTP